MADEDDDQIDMDETSDQPQLAPDTPADTLHAHVEKHIKLPGAEKFENEPLMNELTQHPNLSSQSIEKLYNHMMDSHSQDETGEAEPYSYEWADNLMKHPNTPMHIKKDYLNRTFHPDHPNSEAHEELANSGVMNEDELRAMSDKAFKAGAIPHAYEQLPPDYYMQHYKEGSQNPEAQEGIGDYGLNGLMASKRHTPETLDRTIDAIAANKYHNLQSENKTPDNASELGRFVRNRNDLSRSQLNNIHQILESTPGEHDYSKDDAIDAILQHPNVDPALLGKYATNKDARHDALRNPNLPKESIDAFIKRVKNPNEYGTRSYISTLLQNPAITKDQVKALIAKGSKDAVHHEMADEADVRNAWNASGKSTEDARNILTAKQVPPDVLKDLVNHKNQDIAVQALNHDKADMSVVQEGLKRKARTVQDAARLHPLVADQQVKEGLKTGKTAISEAYADNDFQEHFDKLPKAEQDEIFKSAHQKYNGSDINEIAKKSKERPEVVVHGKLSMALDPRVSPDIRDKNAKDLTDAFKKMVGKNKEIHGSKFGVLSEQHDEQSRIIRAVADLAEDGNAHAQKAILSNPAMVQNLSNHIDMDKAQPQFLDSIYNQAKQYGTKPPTIYDRDGNPEKFDQADVIKPVFRSPNLPLETFHEIAKNKELMDKIGEGDEFKRYNNLPEAEQKARYNEILNSGSHEAAKSIIQTNAPMESYDRALNMLSSPDRDEVLKENMNHVKSHRPDIYSKAVLGTYNGSGEDTHDKAQSSALERLDPQNVADINLAKQALTTTETVPGHINDKDVLDHVPTSILTRNDVIDHALAVGRDDLAQSMLGRRIYDQTEKLYHQEGRQEKLDHLMTELQQRATTMPQPDSDNQAASNWSEMIEKASNKYDRGNAFQSLKARGANLDFLADMPGQAGQELRKTALQKDLISPEKVSQIAQTGTLGDVLAIANNAVKRTALDAWISKPDLSPKDVSDIASKINQHLLNPEAHTGGRAQSMSEDAYGEYSRRLNTLMGHAIEKSPDDLGTIVSNAFSSPGNVKELTIKDQERIAKDVMNYVSTRPFASDQAKNQAMYDAQKALKRKDLIGDKAQAQLERQVMDTRDFGTLVQMAEENNLSDKGLEFLARAMKEPGRLSSGEIAGLATRFRNNTEPKTVIEMAKTFEAKLAQEREAGNTRQHNENSIKFITSLSHTYDVSSLTTEEAKAKNDFVINYTKKAALNPAVAPYANSELYKMATVTARVDADKALDLLASLPNDRAGYKDFEPLNMSSSGLVNSQRFMEMSTSGVKLEMLAKNARRLTGNNASILVQRAIATPTPEGNARLMEHLNENEFVQMEDSIKLGRSLTDKEFLEVAGGVDNALEGNLIHVAHSRLGAIDDLVKDPNIAAAGAPYMGHEHRQAIMDKLSTFSKVIKSSTFTKDISGLRDKLEKINQIVVAVHGGVKQVAAALRDEVSKTGYNLDIGKTQQSIKSVAQDMSSASMKMDRDQAMKTFDMIQEFHSLDKVAGKELTKQEDTFGILSNVVEQAENLEDQDWKSMFANRPDAMFALSKRSNIPKEALASVDIKAIENAKADDESAHSPFMVESSQWINKMSHEDRKVHGKELMDMYVRMYADKKVPGHTYQKSMTTAIQAMSNHMTRSDVQDMMVGTRDHSIVQNLFREAVSNGAGGEETLKMYVRDHNKIMGTELFRNVKDMGSYQGSEVARVLEPVLKSPHINEDVAGRVCAMFVTNPDVMEASINKMLENPNAPQPSVNRMADQVMSNASANHARFGEDISLGIAKQLLQHPNISEDHFLKLASQSDEEYGKYVSHESPFNPAFMNPKHGGKLFRAQPTVTPKDVPNVDGGKAHVTLNVKSDDYNKMRDTMGLIPAEGMSWVEFKRKYPQQEKNLPKSVKDVFMAAQNKPVMPEQFAAAMRSLDDNGAKYHVTFADWRSPLQRHRGKDQKPNLVVQINNSQEKEQELAKDPKLWALYQHLLMDANGIDAGENSVGLHPTTPHLVSWSRVDTDQGKGTWVIEEYQSDFAQKFRANLNAIMDEMPSGSQIGGHFISRDEMAQYAKVIGRHLEDWADASMQAVIENAKSHGIQNLYMHGAELRGNMSNAGKYTREFWDNKNTKPQTSGFRKIYEEGPRKYGFEECDYTDYPRYSAERLASLNENKLSTKCWVLRLGAPDQRPKRKKKPNLG